MQTPVVRLERAQSLGEEIANSVSHGLGLLLAIIGAPFLVVSAVRHADAISIAATAVFAVTVMLLYGASMLDHGVIYLLIAGTYTPFTLGVLRGAWGWTLFGLIWGLAYTAGVVFYATDSRWRYGHFVWHLFVMAGTACHFVAVYGYAA